MKSILLTGFNGFLGSYIEKYILLNTTHKLTTIGRNKSADIVINLVNEVPEFKEQYDLVIHVLGKTNTKLSSNMDGDLCWEVNVNATLNLLKGLECDKVPTSFVFISSVSVYGLSEGDMIKETEPLNAKDNYGMSKIMAEKYIYEWCEKMGVFCTILRLPLVAGKNPPGNLGAMMNAIRKGFYFNVGSGVAKKSMVLADDIAEVILRSAKVGGIYNLTDGYHPSYKEISKAIAKHFGRKHVFNMPRSIAYLIAKFGDLLGDGFPLNSTKLEKLIKNLTFDDSKAKSAFGWNPRRVLESVDTIFTEQS